MTPTPIVIFSDHPASFSGLARITRDLATRVDEHLKDDFRIASLGYGAPGSSALKFPQYHWTQRDDFLPLELPFIHKDFAQEQDMILLTIGDIQRFLPLADPTFCSDKRFGDWLKGMRDKGNWVQPKPPKLKLWGYFPIDAHGIGGKLGPQLGHTLSCYDRILVPSKWAAEIVHRTLPSLKVDVLPHGIDTEIFKPHPKESSRDQIGQLLSPCMVWPQQELQIPEEALWAGIIATNQSRKDFGLGIEVVAELAKSRPVFLWIHTDAIKREWSLLELLSDFGLLQSSMVTLGNLPDESMAVGYSALDFSFGIGRGEGFGYPIAESLACGVPCICSSYGAQSDYVHPADQIDPFRLRIEGPLNLLRPIHHVGAWANGVKMFLREPEEIRLPSELDWKSLWLRFAEWFKDGL